MPSPIRSIVTDLELERQAIALFERLLQIDEDRREEWLARETRGRPELRSRIEAMREGDRRARLRTGAAADALEEEKPPERLGAYRIAERIGHGGMGSVYRAERATGDFTHVVAIKIIRPGLLSDALVERFRRERQVLAGLSHPNIAQLYGGGETESGSPYFVMELVDGLPLMQWAEEHDAPRRERLRLFADICDAVAAAHRNLVIHRDLTPSNVLVTRDGVVKLIDFGIARPPHREGEAGGSGASIGSLSLTPGYAAPERMLRSEVTTATDIYSLGKLLAKLVPPGSADRELKAIVGRATAQDPLDRYPTADALKEDVLAWRDGFPVAAAGRGRRYVAAKFVARHRPGVFAAAAVLLLLVGAIGFTSYSYSRAEAAREAEAARFDQLRSLAHYMLFDHSDRLARVVGNTAARAAIAERAQRYLTSLAASAEADEGLRLETAQGFIRLALIQGVAAHPNLGKPESAKANLDRAEAMLVELGDPQNPAVGASLARARAYRSLTLLHADSKPEEARQQLDLALQALAAVPRSARDWDWMDARSVVRKAQIESADLALETDALARLARLLARETREWPEAMRSSSRARLDRAFALQYLGSSYYNRGEEGHYRRALPLFRRADRIYGAVEAAEPNEPLVLYWRGWNNYYGYAAAATLGNDAEAGRLLQQARDSVERLLTIEENDESLVTFAERLRESQAELFAARGRFDEAIALQQQVVDGRRANVTAERTSGSLSDLAYGYAILGSIGRDAADRELACESWQSAEALMAEVAARGELRGYVESLRGGLRANLRRCAAGRPVTAFEALS